MKIVITGATGFIGRATLLALVQAGHELTVVARDPKKNFDLPGKWVAWSGVPNSFPISALENTDAVIHLAGEPVAEKKWSPEVKKRILDSRVLGTRALVAVLEALPSEKRPKTMISASAIGLYGVQGDSPLTESSPAGKGFLAEVVQAWEKESNEAKRLGLRVVLLRTGVVLGHGGGALAKMQPVILGKGQQWMSWIHLQDVVRFILFALENDPLNGAYNLCAPHPERNQDFTRSFAKALGVPVVPKTPEFILKMILGEMSEILLGSQKVLPEKTMASGFRFHFQSLDSAWADLFPSGTGTEQVFEAVQFIPRPVEEVFQFFSRAENLETLTPPWLEFHIEKKTTPEIQQNTLIDYKLKIHGFPVRWRSRIEEWQPNREFVDSQVQGPYSKWRHTHRFQAVSGGTLIQDRVVYQVPLGRAGKWLLGCWIRKDVNRIFDYRKKKIAEVFQS